MVGTGARGEVLIIGAGRGLGAHLQPLFSSHGWSTCLISSSIDKTVVAGHEYYSMPRTEAEVTGLVDQHLIRPWSLVVVASGGGFGKSQLFESFDSVSQISWINFGLHYCFLKAFHRNQIETTMIVFGSIAARENIASPAYTLAKNQLEAMVRVYGRKVVSDGINLICVSLGGLFCEGNAMDRLRLRNPGAFEEFQSNRLPRKKFLDPRDIFEFITYLQRVDASVWCGSVLTLEGGESSHL